MEQTFFTDIKIEKVRHLENIRIPLGTQKRKHLILTGKNGSGKTSVLEAMVRYIQSFLGEDSIALEKIRRLQKYYFALNHLKDSEQNRQEFYKKSLNSEGEELKNLTSEIVLNSNSNIQLKEKYERGNFIFAYYRAQREFQVETYENIEKVELQNKYNIVENPGAKLTKYLVDLKATQAFTKDVKKAEKIDRWFKRFENILKTIFEDEHLELKFNDETFQFSIHESDRESFDFNTMSSGYAAVLDIINDLIMRMEAQSGLRAEFDMEGIVLIDEIETHLHLELQKKILPVLTELFPNIQFIITTHSPFILSSLDDAVIYDLENRTLVRNGLKNLPYEGIVEGYFRVDVLSKELREKFERYKALVSKDELSDEEYEEIDHLEYYLDEIPDYLAQELTAEYSKMKLEFENRG
ncbi:MAG: AAA family ATPase [Anaerobutyricum soehngenii]|uniref:AAA+ ATPase domain n=1 Tax=Anaerobutyricum hallii TaxID=39488 RepID=A0A285Q0F1_9FIRM|nr:AAA family ATPase [Anaerobutyricum hallii]MCI7272233.1 AAA family ATPase [Anaerobutyricum hallii]MDY5245120.1 AAA family ATPase [Anaerobutyricum soehngenii]SOB73655.1 AAA+ ATPase domain [Anaerobutyricum hallii]